MGGGSQVAKEGGERGCVGVACLYPKNHNRICALEKKTHDRASQQMIFLFGGFRNTYSTLSTSDSGNSRR